MIVDEVRSGVVRFNRIPVLPAPVAGVVNLQLVKLQLAGFTLTYKRDRQPGPTFFSAHLVSIGEFGLAVAVDFHVIQDDMEIGNRNAMEVPQPWEICRLHDGDHHGVRRSRYRYTEKSCGW